MGKKQKKVKELKSIIKNSVIVLSDRVLRELNASKLVVD
jgi:hypothetical protein